MYHNDYLYNNDGIFEWISWDLNMIFNGYPGSSLTDLEATEFLIDEPVKGTMSNYPLVEAIFKNEEYVEKYHEYLETLSEGYLAEDNLNEKVLTVYEMIKSYVETDPSAFYTYEQFETALFQDQGESLSLISFIEKRIENVAQQLSGEIASTNDGQGNTGSGSMGGKGGMGQTQPGMTEGTGEMPELVDGERPARPEGVDGEMPELVDGERPARPEGVDGEMPELVDGEMPAAPATVDGEMPEMPQGGNQSSQQGRQDEAVNVVVDVEASSVSTTDIAIFLSMLVITIGATIYLSRKH